MALFTVQGIRQISAPLVLDGVANVLSAYSLRKLNSSYGGAAVRIRESAGNTQQDIGFAGQNFDVASFSSFVGGATGFVAKWYDQSGNGNDIVQTTNDSSHQPRITLNSFGSLPGLQSLGNLETLSGTWVSAPSSALTVELVGGNTQGATNGVFELTPDSTINHGFSLFYTSTQVAVRRSNTSAVLRDAIKTIDTSLHLVTGYYTGTLTRVLVDGVVGTDDTSTQAVQSGSTALVVSALTGNFPMSGTIGELIFINQDLSAGGDSTLRMNQKAYWGTP